MRPEAEREQVPFLGLKDLERLHQLREMLKHSNRRIARLKKLPAFLQGDLAQEEAFAFKTREEIQRVEKSLLESEMGFQ